MSASSTPVTNEQASAAEVEPPRIATEIDQKLEVAKRKIVYGNASLAEVRLALSEEDTAELTNTMHALFSMRWHRGVYKLLYKLWELDRDSYPELNWKDIAREPARIALASTINRIQIKGTDEFQEYIRSFKEHPHEFVRAQVVVSLGFNGDPVDLDYLVGMASADNDYVAQSAITGMGLMGNTEAKNALMELGKTYVDTERGAVINGILRDAYKIYLKEEVEK